MKHVMAFVLALVASIQFSFAQSPTSPTIPIPETPPAFDWSILTNRSSIAAWAELNTRYAQVSMWASQGGVATTNGTSYAFVHDTNHIASAVRLVRIVNTNTLTCATVRSNDYIGLSLNLSDAHGNPTFWGYNYTQLVDTLSNGWQLPTNAGVVRAVLSDYIVIPAPSAVYAYIELDVLNGGTHYEHVQVDSYGDYNTLRFPVAYAGRGRLYINSDTPNGSQTVVRDLRNGKPLPQFLATSGVQGSLDGIHEWPTNSNKIVELNIPSQNGFGVSPISVVTLTSPAALSLGAMTSESEVYSSAEVMNVENPTVWMGPFVSPVVNGYAPTPVLPAGRYIIRYNWLRFQVPLPQIDDGCKGGCGEKD